MTKRSSIISGRGLTRHRSDGGPLILDHVDFELFAGDRVGLVGASGSGKSSLFRAIVKLDAIDEGEILFHGEPLSLNQIPAFRRRVIYLAQRPAFVVGSVRENLLVPLRFHTSSAVSTEIDCESWLAQVGKPISFLDQSIDSLSGGEQQLVSLLRAIQLAPEILLLDEPTASLDTETVETVERVIDHWFQQSSGRAYAWTSHNADQIARRSNRQVKLISGRLADVDSSKIT